MLKPSEIFEALGFALVSYNREAKKRLIGPGAEGVNRKSEYVKLLAPLNECVKYGGFWQNPFLKICEFYIVDKNSSQLNINIGLALMKIFGKKARIKTKEGEQELSHPQPSLVKELIIKEVDQFRQAEAKIVSVEMPNLKIPKSN